MVEEHQPASTNRVTAWLDILGLDMVVPVSWLRPLALANIAKSLDLSHSGRRKLVIEQRGDTTEALFAKKFLGVQATIRPTELGMPLMGHFAKLTVWHR
jgi:hypothetical protein